MRAADALFARPGAPSAATTGTGSEPPAKASMPPAASTPPAATSLPPAGPSTPPAVQSTGERPAPERSGRILQVIDEAPLPQFAALEAEYAPKRRGRKPGSKNKPKVGKPDIAAAAAVANVAVGPRDAMDREVAEPLPEPFAPSDAAPIVSTRAPGLQTPALQTPALQTVEAIAAVETAPRGQRRPIRGLERVKLGEGWKRRRLPRVCW